MVWCVLDKKDRVSKRVCREEKRRRERTEETQRGDKRTEKRTDHERTWRGGGEMGRRKASDSCESIEEEQNAEDKRPSQGVGCGNIAEGDKKNEDEDEDDEEEEEGESTGQMGVMLREERLGWLMERLSGWMREETSSASRT